MHTLYEQVCEEVEMEEDMAVDMIAERDMDLIVQTVMQNKPSDFGSIGNEMHFLDRFYYICFNE